jgi:hypothetical protein
MRQLAAMIISILFLALPRAAKADALSELNLEQKTLLKAYMESVIEQTTGHQVACHFDFPQCIYAYADLLNFDWKNSHTIKSKPLIVSLYQISEEKSDHYRISYFDSDARLKRIFGINRVSTEFTLPIGWAGAVTNKSSVNGNFCRSQEKFYDDLFKDDRLEIVIVFGYRDEHNENVTGVLQQQFLKTSKVNVDVTLNNDTLAYTVRQLIEDGFTGDAVNDFELEFTKPIFYKGAIKTAKVRLVNSTVICPKEELELGSVQRKDNDLVCDLQKKATLNAKQAWKSAFGQADAIAYIGHSRLGAGPDFGPLSSKLGSASLVKSGLDLLKLENKSAALYMGSCNSIEYFSKTIEEAKSKLSDSKKLMFFGTAASGWFDDSADEAFRFVKMLTEAKCPESITGVMNLHKSVFFGSNQIIHLDKPFLEKEIESHLVYSLDWNKNSELVCMKWERNENGGYTNRGQVDFKNCVSGYYFRKTRDNGLVCRAVDRNGITFGNPVDKALCRY